MCWVEPVSSREPARGRLPRHKWKTELKRVEIKEHWPPWESSPGGCKVQMGLGCMLCMLEATHGLLSTTRTHPWAELRVVPEYCQVWPPQPSPQHKKKENKKAAQIHTVTWHPWLKQRSSEWHLLIGKPWTGSDPSWPFYCLWIAQRKKIFLLISGKGYESLTT